AFLVPRACLGIGTVAGVLASCRSIVAADSGPAAGTLVGASAGQPVGAAALDPGGWRSGALLASRSRPAGPALRIVGGAVRLNGRRRGAALGAVGGRIGGRERGQERSGGEEIHAAEVR